MSYICMSRILVKDRASKCYLFERLLELISNGLRAVISDHCPNGNSPMQYAYAISRWLFWNRAIVPVHFTITSTR